MCDTIYVEKEVQTMIKKISNRGFFATSFLFLTGLVVLISVAGAPLHAMSTGETQLAFALLGIALGAILSLDKYFVQLLRLIKEKLVILRARIARRKQEEKHFLLW